jgi:hypothetical protein
MTSSTLEMMMNQTERLTINEQWELLTHLIQRLRRPVLPPATEKTASFSELLRNTQGLWQAGDGLEYQLQIRAEWDQSS